MPTCVSVSIAQLLHCRLYCPWHPLDATIDPTRRPLRSDKSAASKKKAAESPTADPVSRQFADFSINSNAPIQFSSNLVEALQTNTEVRPANTSSTHPPIPHQNHQLTHRPTDRFLPRQEPGTADPSARSPGTRTPPRTRAADPRRNRKAPSGGRSQRARPGCLHIKTKHQLPTRLAQPRRAAHPLRGPRVRVFRAAYRRRRPAHQPRSQPGERERGD
jgi:hypothetical protein